MDLLTGLADTLGFFAKFLAENWQVAGIAATFVLFVFYMAK